MLSAESLAAKVRSVLPNRFAPLCPDDGVTNMERERPAERADALYKSLSRSSHSLYVRVDACYPATDPNDSPNAASTAFQNWKRQCSRQYWYNDYSPVAMI